MASSGQLLDQSKELCKAALAGFSENHDLCAESGFFLKKTLASMDTCAVDFHNLGLTKITLANAVSNSWLDCVLHFYQNISSMEKQSIANQLDSLGAQAKQLGLAFRVIAKWSRDLAGSLHQAYLETQEDTDNFVRKFKQQVEDAQRKLDRGDSNHYNRVGGGMGFMIGSAVPAIRRPDPEAMRNLEDAESREKKAEVIANKSANLVTSLQALETTTTAIAAFWTTESDTFLTKGQKMKTEEIEFNKMNLEKMTGKENIKFWEKAKSDFGTYVDAMSFIFKDINHMAHDNIVNCFDAMNSAVEQLKYMIDAHPSPSQEFKLDKLDLVLKVPSTIDVKEIMG